MKDLKRHQTTIMLGLLEGIEEYNNQGALLGIEGIEDNELLGALRRMNPIQRQRTVNKLANTGGNSRGSRAEMEKHFGELPVHIKESLLKGDLRLADGGGDRRDRAACGGAGNFRRPRSDGASAALDH